MIQDVHADKIFWLFGGKSIKNVLELGRELRQMSTEAFAHHVNVEKNDFATWAEYSLKDHHLATLLRTTKDQPRMAAIVERRIQDLTRPERPVHHVAEQPPRHMPKQVHHAAEKPIHRMEKPSAPPALHAHTIIKTRNVTPLMVVEPKTEPEKKVIHTPFKTHLKLTHGDPTTEIYVHEVKKPHAAASLLIAHVLLGLAVGIGIAIIIIA